MNKETEEILNNIKNQIDFSTNQNIYREISLEDIEKANILLDYITNLQDNNEYLNKCNIELARRNTKAIEYNNHLIEHAKYHLNLGHLKKMKKILEGSDKE